MDLSDYLLLVGILVATAVLLRRYISGSRFCGTERIPGKTVIITGANTGIGKETAKELARRGGRVILACRDVAKAERVRAEIVEDTENQNVIVKSLDLASLASIRAFATDVMATEARIDILINNAGIFMFSKMSTLDGFEMHLGVNHMGHFLLTMLLLDKIKASAPSRIINVSAKLHRLTHINFDDLNGDKCYNGLYAYAQSKLANLLFTAELARKLQNSGVTVNALHPGVVKTEIARYIVGGTTLVSRFLHSVQSPVSWFMKTPLQGAQTTLYCALSSELEGVSGKYFSDCKETAPAKQAKDEETAKRLWDISEKWTGLA